MELNSVSAAAKHDMALAVTLSNTAAAQSVLVQGSVLESQAKVTHVKFDQQVASAEALQPADTELPFRTGHASCERRRNGVPIFVDRLTVCNARFPKHLPLASSRRCQTQLQPRPRSQRHVCSACRARPRCGSRSWTMHRGPHRRSYTGSTV